MTKTTKIVLWIIACLLSLLLLFSIYYTWKANILLKSEIAGLEKAIDVSEKTQSTLWDRIRVLDEQLTISNKLAKEHELKALYLEEERKKLIKNYELEIEKLVSVSVDERDKQLQNALFKMDVKCTIQTEKDTIFMDSSNRFNLLKFVKEFSLNQNEIFSLEKILTEKTDEIFNLKYSIVLLDKKVENLNLLINEKDRVIQNKDDIIHLYKKRVSILSFRQYAVPIAAGAAFVLLKILKVF